MMYQQKEGYLILTGNNGIITNPDYVVTLCFQIEDGSKRGKSCDISMTKKQVEMLHSKLTTWLEYMMRNPEERAEAEAET